MALMPNHFHLLIEDTEGLLSRGMRHVLGVYTQRFNKRHRTDGALFRGRFRSRLVETEEYLGEVVRYIHLNPVRANLAKTAGAYRWSSHIHYLSGAESVPNWLTTTEVFRRFGGDNPDGRVSLDNFVHESVEAQVAALLEGSPWRPFLGTPEFIDRWRKEVRASPVGPSEEVPERSSLIALTAAEVIQAVTLHFGVMPDQLASPARGRGRSNLPRTLALVLLVDRTRLTHRQVAELLKLSPSSVGSLAGKHRANIRDSHEMAQHMDAIHRSLADRMSRSKTD
jgi:hypothetical protein